MSSSRTKIGETPARTSDDVSIDAAPRPERTGWTQPVLPLPPTAPARVERRQPVAIPAPTASKASVSASGSVHKRPSAMLLGGAALVTALAVVAVSYATAHSDRTDSTVAAAPGANTASTIPSATPTFPLSAMQLNQRAALAWMSTNVPHTAAILTEPTLSGRLTTLGFSTVRTTPGPALPRYIVSDVATRADVAAGAVLARSVSVARFGTNSSTVEVRSVLSVSANRVASVLAADAANRRMAGTALVSNPRLTITAAGRAVLRRGQLDLRPATFLALLAADTAVRVTDVPADPVEAAASRPRRTITFAASGAEAATIRAAADALPADYAPMTIDSSTPGSLTLAWTPSAQPVRSVT